MKRIKNDTKVFYIHNRSWSRFVNSKSTSKQRTVVKIMNSKVNLPYLNEKQEAELFSKWFDAFVEGIEYLKEMDKK